jgi:AraC-like DNA-binding protein
MIFSEISPHKKLQEFVRLYRIRHFLIPSNLSSLAKPYPARSEQCMIFYPRGIELAKSMGSQEIHFRSRAIICGQMSQRLDRSSLFNEILIIVVVFQPGILYRLTGIPFYELNEKDINLEAVFPREARLVNELLSSAYDYIEMLRIIEDFLWQLLKRVRVETGNLGEVFNLMTTFPQSHTLENLASQACLSLRQFERKSYLYLGVSPKFFIRLSRFAYSLQLKLKNPGLDWLSIALICGYHDYQHLVRDYLEFANTTPNILLSEESRSLERGLGLVEPIVLECRFFTTKAG